MDVWNFGYETWKKTGQNLYLKDDFVVRIAIHFS